MEKIIDQKRALVIYLPVLHKGYLDFLRKYKEKTSRVLVLDNPLVEKLYKYEPSISAMSAKDTVVLLHSLGLNNVVVVTEEKIKLIKDRCFFCAEDEVTTNFFNKYLKEADVLHISVFLRWDRAKVLSELNIGVEETRSEKHVKFMQIAYREGDNSSDWWRQVGAVVVKNGKILLRGYNRGMPDDHTPYQLGALRDYMEVGERPEISSTIHGEQMVISEAARRGISIKGAAIYVTHFPCAVCAKLIAAAGFKNCYFGEGSSNADGEKVLKSAGVHIEKVTVR